MKIEIKDKALQPNFYSSFVVECEAMFGDADGYSTVTVGGFKIGEHEELLLDFLNTCEGMKNATRRNFDKVEGFIKWFDVDSLTEKEYEELPELVKNATEYWLRDPQSHGEYYADFESYEVYYYDENGVKYNVSIDLHD